MSQTEVKSLQIAIDSRIATITLNRPDVRNAFNDELITELIAAFRVLGARDDVRCIVLAAAGSAFCAGADLNWMRRMAAFSREENLADAARLAEMLRTIAECAKPTLARIQGDVYAGGLGLVAACDIAVSAETAVFCASEVRLGLIPATISPYLVRAIGARAAQRYFLTAERFSAADAQRIGLVHEVVGAQELDAKVGEIAQALLAAGPNAVAACKQLIRDVAGSRIDEDLINKTVFGIADIRASDEARDGVQAFLQKRVPGWLQGPG